MFDKYVLNSEQSISKLHFMIQRDYKIFKPIWDFWEDQILLDKEKTLKLKI